MGRNGRGGFKGEEMEKKMMLLRKMKKNGKF